ncbi:MAG: choice-of-anchor J domain-containing protein, partial [Clostridia bacterium]|nr:choice-of-anchor J domain-containing protein [Clostridia bacterium]
DTEGAYTVTWKNWDGETIEVDENMAYGSVPVYDGMIPTRPLESDYYCYEFAGWGPVVGPVNGNITYTARFRLTAKQLEEGLIKAFGFEYEDEVDEMTYIDAASGAGWGWSINHPVYDLIDYAHDGHAFMTSYSYRNGVGSFQADNWMITPAIEIPDRNYATHMTFYATNINSSYPEAVDVCVGSSADPASMTVIQTVAPSTGTSSWSFYDVDLSDYAGQTVYVGFHDTCYDQYELWMDDIEFRYETATYNVTWENYDGEVLGTGTVEGIAVPSYEGETPQRPADELYTYTFAGWTDGENTYAADEIPEISDDTTFTAVYSTEDVPPSVEVDGFQIICKDYHGYIKDAFVISGHFTSYRDIKTAKDKADYYYSFTSAKIAANGGSFSLNLPAPGEYTVLIRYKSTEEEYQYYSIVIESSVDVQVNGGVVTAKFNGQDAKSFRFASGTGLDTFAEIKNAAGYVGLKASSKYFDADSDTFTYKVKTPGKYSYIAEFEDGYTIAGEFTVEEPVSNMPEITANGVTGNWNAIARVKYAPGTIASSAEFKTAVGLRVLYAPAEGGTATYRQGVLSGDWSFEIVYADGTSEIVNKTF